MQRINENDIRQFNNELLGGLGVYVDSDDISWFSLNDLIDILSLTNNMVKSIRDFYIEGVDYKYFKVFENETKYNILNFVRESTIYRLLLETNSNISKLFKHWLSESILPSLNILESFNMETVTDFITMELKTIHAAYIMDKPEDIHESLVKIENKILQTAADDSQIDPGVLEWKKNEDQKKLSMKKDVCPEWIKELVRK